MDGLRLLREIKRQWPRVPVMMITAYADESRRRTADEAGAAAFLSKPIDFDQLKQRITDLAPAPPP